MLLTLRSKTAYIEALMTIWDRYKDLNGEMTKTDTIAILISHFDNKLYDIKEDDEEDSEVSQNLNLATKAIGVINKLMKYGWIEEIHSPQKMEIYVNFPTYATKFIKTIKQIVEPQYDNSLNYATNVYLNMERIGGENEVDHLLYLENAYRDTENLINVMYETFDTMKRFYENLLCQASVDAVLKEHFEDYAINIVEKKFHPLLTSKNTLRYRQAILTKISEVEYNDELTKILISESQRKYDIESNLEALNKVLSMLEYIKLSFENIDDIRDSLKNVHNQYVKVTIEKINYLTHRDESIKDNIFTLLQIYKKNPIKFLRTANKHLRINDYTDLTRQSLYKARKINNHFRPDVGNIVDVYNESRESEFKNELMNNQREKTKKFPLYSVRTIEIFIESLLKSQEMFNTKEISITSDTEYIKLILATNYTGKMESKYSSEILNNTIVSGIYTYPEIIFSRRKNNA